MGSWSSRDGSPYGYPPWLGATAEPLVLISVRAGMVVEGLRHPAQVLVHRARQQRHSDEEQQQYHQSFWRGLAVVLALPTGIRFGRRRSECLESGYRRKTGDRRKIRWQQKVHANTRSRTPENKSSSGSVVSTSERASSYSSVVHSCTCS